MKKDLDHLEAIQEMVDMFYGQVQKDDLIGPIFNRVIQDRWPDHLKKMYGFWQTILLNERAYSGSPFPPHAQLPIGKEHFERWLDLFRSTVEHNFHGEKAKEAIWRAERMAEMFHYKIEYIKTHQNT